MAPRTVSRQLFVTGATAVAFGLSWSAAAATPALAAPVSAHPARPLVSAASPVPTLTPTAAIPIVAQPIDRNFFSSTVVVNATGTRAYVGSGSGAAIDGNHPIVYTAYVTVMDLQHNTVITRISVPYDPLYLRLSPDGTRLYAVLQDNSDSGNQDLAVIDTATNTVLAVSAQPVLATASDPIITFTVSHDGRSLYVVDNDDDIDIVDSTTLAKTGHLILPPPQRYPAGTYGSAGSVLSPDGRTLYVGDYFFDIVYVIDVATGTVTHQLQLEDRPFQPGPDVQGWLPRELRLSPDGSRLYVDNTSRDHSGVQTWDTATDTLLADSLDDGVYVVDPGTDDALSADGSTLYFTTNEGLYALDAATDRVVARDDGRDLDEIVDGIASSPVAPAVYVVDQATGTLLVYDTRAAPRVLTQPTAVTTRAGRPAQLRAYANGEPTPAVAWQRQQPGTTAWTDVPGGSSGAFTPPTSTAGTTSYRAVFANASGTETSAVAAVTVTPAPVVVPPAAHARTVDLPRSVTIGSPSTRVGVAVTESAPAAEVTVALTDGVGHLLTRAALHRQGTGTRFAGTVSIPAAAAGRAGLRWSVTTHSLAHAVPATTTVARPLTVAVRSAAGVNIRRRGTTVTVRGSVKVYAVEPARLRSAAGRVVHVQEHTPRGWVTVRTLKSGSTGHLELVLHSRARIEVRLAVPGRGDATASDSRPVLA